MRYKKKAGDIIFDSFNVFLMLVIIFLVVFPFWQILMISLNDATDAVRGGIYFWPRQFSLASYKEVFSNAKLIPAFSITILKTISGTALSVGLTALFAYALSKKRLVGRKFYSLFALITLFFSGGLIPYYTLIINLKLDDNFLVYIIPGVVNVFNMIILRVFFSAIPASLEESAKMDGASDFRVLMSIYMPLSVPAIATISLYVAVAQWNSWFDAQLFIIENEKLLPLQAILMRIITQNDSEQINKLIGQKGAEIKVTGESLKLAMIIVVTVPIMAVYPFLQKHFVKGMMLGSVKE